VERFWGASGDLWQGWWKQIHALFGGDAFLLSAVGKSDIIINKFMILSSLIETANMHS